MRTRGGAPSFARLGLHNDRRNAGRAPNTHAISRFLPFVQFTQASERRRREPLLRPMSMLFEVGGLNKVWRGRRTRANVDCGLP
eukprot:383068-Prymnesium_polylepis.1